MTEGLEGKVDALAVSVGAIKERLDRYDLNGHYKDLQALADAAPMLLAVVHRQEEFATLTAYVTKHIQVMTEFVQVAPQLIDMVHRETEERDFRDALLKRTRWLRWAWSFIRPSLIFVLGYLIVRWTEGAFHIVLIP